MNTTITTSIERFWRSKKQVFAGTVRI